MKSKPILVSLLVFFATGQAAFTYNSSFSYQGHLADGGVPANGLFEIKFSIYDTNSEGVALAVLTNAPVSITDGLFSITVRPGAGIFNGNPRWLEVAVRTNGSAEPFATLTPRQPLTATPHALFAANTKMLDNKGANDFAPAARSANYISKSGDTMTGALNLPVDGLRVGSNQIVISDGTVEIGALNVSGSITAQSNITLRGNAKIGGAPSETTWIFTNTCMKFLGMPRGHGPPYAIQIGDLAGVHPGIRMNTGLSINGNNDVLLDGSGEFGNGYGIMTDIAFMLGVVADVPEAVVIKGNTGDILHCWTMQDQLVLTITSNGVMNAVGLLITNAPVNPAADTTWTTNYYCAKLRLAAGNSVAWITNNLITDNAIVSVAVYGDTPYYTSQTPTSGLLKITFNAAVSGDTDFSYEIRKP